MSSKALRARWAAIGAAVAVAVGAGGLGIVSATISSGSKSVFVPITPCRLIDTRATTPLGAGQVATFPVRGVNGECTIPAGATSVTGNATITDPSDDGFLTIAPTGGIGTSSNLNWLRGQSPTPNAFTVALSADGRIDVRNDRGTVNLIIDINGYYEDHNHDDRYYTEAETNTALAAKANAADVYTKAQVDGSGMNAVRAAGAVGPSGNTLVSMRIGTFTTVKTGTGTYDISVPGLAPSCLADYPLIIATPTLNGNPRQLTANWRSITCATGNTIFEVSTFNGTGVATDESFNFIVYAIPRGALLQPQDAGAPAPTTCTNGPDGVVCE